jgi:putative transposase
MAERKHHKRPRRKEQQWRALLARYQTCGLSIEAFCRREAVSTASFYRWRALLDDSHGHVDATEAPPAFLDLGALNATPTPRPRLDLKLDLGDGLTLHLVRG